MILYSRWIIIYKSFLFQSFKQFDPIMQQLAFSDPNAKSIISFSTLSGDFHYYDLIEIHLDYDSVL